MESLILKRKKKIIKLSEPKIGKQEIKLVTKVLKSKSLVQGRYVGLFEEEFAETVEGRSSIAVNSGTSALQIALMVCGIGEGDEVIVPAFTFAASANSIALTGAKPVFVDIDSTYNISPSAIQNAITIKTKAILVVHLYGLPANMDAIIPIAKKAGIKIIEDAAQAHLAEISGRRVGTFGDAAAFSFYATKNMTAGEGGMVVLKDSNLEHQVKLLRNQGMIEKYQNEIVGYNMRLSEIHAAIGLTQLSKLAVWTDKRIENAKLLSSGIPKENCPIVLKNYRHVFHQFTLSIPNKRDELAKYLAAAAIQTGVYYPTVVNSLKSFQVDAVVPQAEKATKEVLSIPVHPSLSRREISRICVTVNKWLEHEKN